MTTKRDTIIEVKNNKYLAKILKLSQALPVSSFSLYSLETAIAKISGNQIGGRSPANEIIDIELVLD